MWPCTSSLPANLSLPLSINIFRCHCSSCSTGGRYTTKSARETLKTLRTNDASRRDKQESTSAGQARGCRPQNPLCGAEPATHASLLPACTSDAVATAEHTTAEDPPQRVSFQTQAPHAPAATNTQNVLSNVYPCWHAPDVQHQHWQLPRCAHAKLIKRLASRFRCRNTRCLLNLWLGCTPNLRPKKSP